MMIPFLESDGGNCQNAVILVEELAFMVKLPGDPEGTAIKKREMFQHICGLSIKDPNMNVILLILFSEFLPSSFVLKTMTWLLGPSPTYVYART